MELSRTLRTKTSRQLAMCLNINEAIVCRLYSNKTLLASHHLFNMHLATGIPVSELRKLAGDHTNHKFYTKPQKQKGKDEFYYI